MQDTFADRVPGLCRQLRRIKIASVDALYVFHEKRVHGQARLLLNVMLDRGRSRAVAVIDPFHCCWADSEFDLYQLDNANGKGYGLLERYGEKMPLSDNFEAKRRFYELYTEVAHYHDAQVELNPITDSFCRNCDYRKSARHSASFSTASWFSSTWASW